MSPRTDSVAVASSGLTKRYDRRVVTPVTAVSALDLRIAEGEVYGLLGRNGAGKTTTLRMLLGLIRPTAGTATVLGHPPGHRAGLAATGALVETPAFYPHLSGLDNLRLLARYAGVPASRIGTVLEQAGLTARAGDRFRAYSLGMRQRLGVAAALLKDPRLLVLDEPTNGLDPAGMADMRALIRSLGDGGRTVLLSSHLLGEVEQVCDRVGVMQRGRLVAEGTVAQLRAGTAPSLVVRADPADRARSLLLAFGEVTHEPDGALRVAVNPDRAAELNAELVRAGIAVRELRPVRPSLEDVFLHLTDSPAPSLVGAR